jgi:hypothetical protein
VTKAIPHRLFLLLQKDSFMSAIGDWFGEKLDRIGMRPVCRACGNNRFDELAMGFNGSIHCRQDIPAIGDSCQKRIGWRVIDLDSGRVLRSGPGMTMNISGTLVDKN